eukprot:5780748-Pyramimonas_sp.AAC.1
MEGNATSSKSLLSFRCVAPHTYARPSLLERGRVQGFGEEIALVSRRRSVHHVQGCLGVLVDLAFGPDRTTMCSRQATKAFAVALLNGSERLRVVDTASYRHQRAQEGLEQRLDWKGDVSDCAGCADRL